MQQGAKSKEVTLHRRKHPLHEHTFSFPKAIEQELGSGSSTIAEETPFYSMRIDAGTLRLVSCCEASPEASYLASSKAEVSRAGGANQLSR